MSTFDELARDVREGYETGDKIPNTDLLDQAQRSAERGDGVTTLMLVMAQQFSGASEDKAKALRAFATYQRVEALKIYDQAGISTRSITEGLTNEQIRLIVRVRSRLDLAYFLEKTVNPDLENQ